MVLTHASALSVPIFSGHGNASAQSTLVLQQARLDALTPSGSVLLSACHEVFCAEISVLSPNELDFLNIDLADFSDKTSLLSPPNGRYRRHSLFSGCSLFLVQTLRYLAYVEAFGVSNGSSSPFTDLLRQNLKQSIGILGFSSGILPASVVATSVSTASYLSHAVEVYRLAIWIGIRCQKFRTRVLGAASLPNDCSLPWSLVFSGMTPERAQEAIECFDKRHHPSSLFVTSIGKTSVTISGFPHLLARFAEEFAMGPILETSVDTLYHVPIHHNSLQEEVLQDVASRGISFPSTSEISIALRSTVTGDIITRASSQMSLVQSVVEMLLTQPIHWSTVITSFGESVSGNDSVQLLNFGPGTSLARALGRDVPENIRVIDLTTAEFPLTPQVPLKQDSIAIVGMALRLPGAQNTRQLWELLTNERSTITEIPPNRFNTTIYNDDYNPGRMMRARTGNFIDGVDEFDNKFFKVSPREAQAMDPQQRILLHVAYEALEDAGYVPNSSRSFRPECFACYIGAATQDYTSNLRKEIDVYYSTGTLKAFLSGRISYALKLSGPSLVVDTACSSSSVAMYLATRALLSGDCDSALVGGVNIISSPDAFLGLDRAHFLSPTGQCKPFDAAADGYARGEGCTVFVVKRLSDAVGEGDNILGIIRGIDVNQSGAARSITHPHVATQVSLFQRLLHGARIPAERVSVVEAHGTGTQAGDTAELQSIRQVLSANRNSNNPLHITSIKANIGHVEAASGAAGLAKLLLMLRHQVIPRQISLRNLNPAISPLDFDHTVIDTVSTTWKSSRSGTPRVAMLNNFGASGSNSALLVEEFVPQELANSEIRGMSYVFCISAKDRQAVEELRQRYLRWFDTPDAHAVRLTDISYTSVARRQVYQTRIALCARDRQELVEKLSMATVHVGLPKSPRLVFVFSGQGGQYLGMGGSLYSVCPAFKQIVDECNAILNDAGYADVLSIINPRAKPKDVELIEEIQAYQSALFVVQYALLCLWQFWGASPVAVIGHSLGEFVALVAAGVLSYADALIIVAHRARLMATRCELGSTGMLAVNISACHASDLLSTLRLQQDITISCFNSPTDIVFSGPIPRLRILKRHIDESSHCKATLLQVSFGYHSSAMDPILENLTIFCSGFVFRAPIIPIASNVLGRVVCPKDGALFQAHYIVQHCRQPVLFLQGVQSLLGVPEMGSLHGFLEISPHPTIAHFLRGPQRLVLPSLRRNQDPMETLMSSVAQMYAVGAQLNWRATFSHLSSPTCISLPSYPWASSRFWVPYTEESMATSSIHRSDEDATGYRLLARWIQRPSYENGNTALFETPIINLEDLICGHKVSGTPLCPASVYIEQVLKGFNLSRASLGFASDAHPKLRSIEFITPLIYDATILRYITIRITLGETTGSFGITSNTRGSHDTLDHVRGEIHLDTPTNINLKLTQAVPSVSRRILSISQDRDAEFFSTRTIYQIIFPRVVEYSPAYHTIRSMTIHKNGEECVVKARPQSDSQQENYMTSPVFLDTMLHAVGFLANLRAGSHEAYICNEVGNACIVSHFVDSSSSYSLYCTASWIPEQNVIVGDAFAISEGDPARIVARIKHIRFKRVRLNNLKVALQESRHSRIVEPRRPQQNRGAVRPPLKQSMTPSATSSRILVQEDPLLSPVGISMDDGSNLKAIIASVLEIPVWELQEDVELGDYGLDSLTSLEALQKISAAYQLNLPSDTFLHRRTLRSLQDLVHIKRRISHSQATRQHTDIADTSQNRNEGHDDGSETELPLKTLYLDQIHVIQTYVENKSPLFLVHDGSGLVNQYTRLPPLHRSLWAIPNPNFLSSRPWQDIPSMANQYALGIVETGATEVIVGGWSFGGVVAYQMVDSLRKYGISVKGLLLIDAPCPTNHVTLPMEVIDSVVGLDYTSSSIRKLVTAQFSMNSKLLERFNPEPHRGREEIPPLVLLRSAEAYDHAKSPPWLCDRDQLDLFIPEWEALIGKPIQVLTIPGNHFQPFHPVHVPVVAERIQEACNLMEGQQ